MTNELDKTNIYRKRDEHHISDEYEVRRSIWGS